MLEMSRRDLIKRVSLMPWSLAAMVAKPSIANTAFPVRIAAMDWEFAETLMALSIQPIAMPQASSYQDFVADPRTLDGIADLGRIEEPNLELLQHLAPDLILTSTDQGALEPLLNGIAPTTTLGIYTGDGHPYQAALRETEILAAQLGAEKNWLFLKQQVLSTIAASRQRLSGQAFAPIYLTSFVDDLRIAVYGKGSLFNDILEDLGLENAWQAQTNIWGFSTVSIDRLAVEERAILVHVGGSLDDPQQQVERNPLWAHLPFVKAGRVIGLPRIWYFGALSSALRFTIGLTDGLLQVVR